MYQFITAKAYARVSPPATRHVAPIEALYSYAIISTQFARAPTRLVDEYKQQVMSFKSVDATGLNFKLGRQTRDRYRGIADGVLGCVDLP